MPRSPAPRATTKPSGPPIGLIGAVVAFVVAVIAVLVYLAVRGDGLEATGSADTLPSGGGLVVNPDAPDDAVQVHVYEDFQCPFCGLLERSAGEGLFAAADTGDIELTYTFMSFLDPVSDDQSSSRAANAALCANDAGVFADWHAAAFAAQPEEGIGYPDAALTGFAEQAGLAGEELDAFTTCVSEQTYAAYVTDMQEAANQAGVSGTPTVEINGERLDNDELTRLQADPSSLTEIVEANQ
jgi:protein-disulfide isomerase